MQTTPTRVPEAVHGEVQAAARLLGCNASELLERAWNSFRQSAEFGEELARAQKAFATVGFRTFEALPRWSLSFF
ncbi:MAG: hypothetical protein M0005_11215 [Actinomycetota bacterium]|jgi:hypothetical protein|nr:hypothetical protein [Actinomycetota bacterium]